MKAQHSGMRPLCLLVLLLGSLSHAGAWGVPGHEAMARVAQGWLSNDVAARVTAILGTNDLASVSVWADHLRDARRSRGPLRSDPQAHDFNRRFPQNENWHYVNLPLGTIRYEPSSGFVSSNDVVQALNRSIAVLEGRCDEMTKAEALRWLVHLVGDIHQPLHVGCGFYRFEPDGKVSLISEPGEATGHPHDRGGNLLRYDGNRGLHGYWDANLVEAFDMPPDSGQLEAMLRSAVRPRSWRTLGPRQDWTAKWAADAVQAAREAYKNIEFLGAQFDPTGALTNINIKLPANYQLDQLARAKAQLAKSAFHLAELLNRLDWP
jgi:hypothetical protein